MPFIQPCPYADCGKFMLLEDEARGTQVQCLVCKREMIIPPEELPNGQLDSVGEESDEDSMDSFFDGDSADDLQVSDPQSSSPLEIAANATSDAATEDDEIYDGVLEGELEEGEDEPLEIAEQASTGPSPSGLKPVTTDPMTPSAAQQQLAAQAGTPPPPGADFAIRPCPQCGTLLKVPTHDKQPVSCSECRFTGFI